jgi:hypothetical protein
MGSRVMESNGVLISKLAKGTLGQLRRTVRLQMPLQGTNHYILTVPTAAVLLENRREIGLVPVPNDIAVITIVVHKQVDTNKSMHQRAAGEIRRTIHMNKLT